MLDNSHDTRLKFSTLVDCLSYRSVHQPNQIAYTFLVSGETEEVSLSYQELDRKARAIATELQSFGATEKRALLLYPPGLEFIAAFFGCLYAGVIAIPAYPPRRNQKLTRLKAIIQDAKASLVLTTTSIESTWESFREELKPLDLDCLITDRIPTHLTQNWVPPQLEIDSLAFLQYTSGSTGIPKGVMVSHGNLLYNEEMMSRASQHTEESIVVGWLPLHHDMGLIGNVIQPLYIGIPSIIMSPVAFLEKPIRWLKAISHYKATTSGAPNFAYDLCINKITPQQKETLDLSSWEVAFNGAEPVRAQTINRFVETFAPYGFHREAFYPCYGMAETTLFVSGGVKSATPVICSVDSVALEQNSVVITNSEQEEAKKIVSCGQSWLDQKIAIANPETLTLCPPGKVGEIWVSGSNVAQGYWNRPEETEKVFHAYTADTQAGPFLRTGDLGFLHDGELFVTGRLKDVIIIFGRNHYPQDIELTVEQSHPALRPTCGAAFSVEMSEDEKLVIVQEVERNYLRKLNKNEVIGAIRQAVSEEHDLQVHAILLLKTGSIPKTSSGKIQRSACRDGFLANSLDVVADWRVNPQSQDNIWQQETELKLPSPIQTEDHKKSYSANNFLSNCLDKNSKNIEAWLILKVADQLKINPDNIDIQQPLAYYGLNSLVAVNIASELQEWLERQLSPTLVYDYPSIEALAQHLAVEPTTLPTNLKVENSKKVENEAIAIIGIGCRFPGSENPEAFWQLLHEGRDAIAEFPPSRRDVNTDYKSQTCWGGFLEQVDRFDPQFFGISPREAETIDPQQRLLLEVTWEALENASQAPDRIAGSHTGVFIGISNNDYSQLLSNHITNLNAYSATGNAFSIAANRISYLLDLRGPSWAVDTACSSSLVAVHQACQSLNQRECQMAIAGGVNLILTPQLTIAFSQANMMASDNRCKTFDAKADGYVRGEGCGIVILKRLSDALRDGDNIHAVIRGSAVNQDGRSNGLTAPNGLSQQAVIRQALVNAGVSATQISYVETHGTGTSLGDPIEVNSLKEVLMANRELEQTCWIGSVKTNIGHLEAAAGIAGLIKVILSLQHEEIPPHLHLNQLNPLISLAGTPLSIPIESQKWTREKQQRFAGVSSFGFGGTNAHIILEEAPKIALAKLVVNRPQYLLTLSAKSEVALRELAQRYQGFIAANSQISLADICFTANTGRSHFEYRLAIVAANLADLNEKLVSLNSEKSAFSALFSYQYLPSTTAIPKIVFLFTGQGSQYTNMGRQLYETQLIFRQVLEQCDTILQPYLDKSLLSILYPDVEENSPLDQTSYAQPALFALEYALAQLWQSWGIIPDAVIGHSLGEYVAACVAGVFSLEDGLKLVAARGRLMQQLPSGGAMVSLAIGFEQVKVALKPYRDRVTIAAINGPASTVISGQSAAVEAIVTQLETQGIKSKQLLVSHAFHSPLMQPMLAEFEQVTRQVSYAEPRIKLISNVTGNFAFSEITTPEYWCRHIISPVNFAAGMETLNQQGYEIFIECGPKPVLLGMGRECLPLDRGIWLPSLRLNQADWSQMLASLGELYVRGVKVNWAGLYRDYSHHKVVLPTYPFQRQNYWIETKIINPKNSSSHEYCHPLLVRKLSLASRIKEIIFESYLSSEIPAYLADHRVFGQVILPGAAYIEMAIAAGFAVFRSDAIVLENVAIEQPLILSPGQAQTLQLILSQNQSQGYYFEIISLNQSPGLRESQECVHATGNVLPGIATIPTVDLANWENRAESEVVDSKKFYQQSKQQGMEYGPYFQALQQGWIETEQGQACLQLPANLEDTSGYQIHPILLDGGFQWAIAAALLEENEKSLYLPVGIARLHVYRQSSDRLLVQAKRGAIANNTLTSDLLLVDPSGVAVAKIEGLLMRKATQQSLERMLSHDFSDWLYQVRWQPQRKKEEERGVREEGLGTREREEENSSLAPSPYPLTPSSGGYWLIFADSEEMGEQLTQQLIKQGKNCAIVTVGETYQKLDNEHYQINPLESADFSRLLQADNRQIPLQGVIHLWSIASDRVDQLDLDQLRRSQELGCASVLHLVQALTENWESNSLQLWLVTKGSQAVETQTMPVQVQQAPLWGLGRVIALEYSNLHCYRLDLDPMVAIATDAAAIAHEILSSDGEDQIAHRQSQRYVARLVRHRSVNSANPAIIREAASYLITGGLGALGLQIAQWLVERGVRHLILAGRHEPKAAARVAIAELEQAGAIVTVEQVDVSSPEEMDRIFAKIQASSTPLRGVIHAAGILDDGILQQQNWERFVKVMAPKVQGAWLLHKLTQDIDLDWFVCFSSIAALMGSAGQGNYAAANAFLDALIQHRHALGLPGLSVQWGLWSEESGMASNLSPQIRERLADSGFSFIPVQAGLQILEQLMSQPEAQVAVMPLNWEQFCQKGFPGRMPPFLEVFQQQFGQQTRERSPFLLQWETTPKPQRYPLLMNYVRSQVARVLGITDLQQVKPQQPLFDLGLDSLMALDLRNQLQISFGQTLRSTLLFDYPTVEALVNYLAREVLEQFETEETIIEEQKIDELADLSEDEVFALLAKELD